MNRFELALLNLYKTFTTAPKRTNSNRINSSTRWLSIATERGEVILY